MVKLYTKLMKQVCKELKKLFISNLLQQSNIQKTLVIPTAAVTKGTKNFPYDSELRMCCSLGCMSFNKPTILVQIFTIDPYLY